MAPEQFLGERGDEKSDQFSFCVALYEALYGERPFAGDDMLSISVNVTTEQLRPLPKDRGVPAWVRRVILRGLRSTASDRWDSMAALIARAVERSGRQAAQPVRRRRDRRRGRPPVVVGVADGVAAARRSGAGDRALRQEAKHDAATGAGERRRPRAACARGRSRRSTGWIKDGVKRSGGRPAPCSRRSTRTSTRPSGRSKPRSCSISRDSSLRTELADLQLEHLLFAEDFRLQSKADVLRERLVVSDVNGSKRRRWRRPAPCSFA